MRRRTFTRLAGASLVGAVLADNAAAPDRSTAQRHSQGPWSPPKAIRQPHSQPSLSTLTKAVANAKRAYQACRYTEVMSQMPTLLPALQATCDDLDGDARLRAYALAADAYHVVASVLLKLDDHGLAWLAADRSMRAATLSQDSLAVGSSARIITHALMADGHSAPRPRSRALTLSASRPTCATRPRNRCRCTDRCCCAVLSPLRMQKTATAA